MRFYKKGIVLFKLIISYLSILSIRSKTIYVFGSWRGNKFSDNPKYLYLEALKDKNLTAIWITKNKNVCTTLKALGYRVYLYKSLLGIYYQLRASVYFTCMSKQDVLTLVMGNATRINLWHGVGLKKILHDDKITQRKNNSNSKSAKKKIWKTLEAFPRRKEYILSTSDKMSEIFANAFKKEREKVLQLGQPRNDIFFSDEFEIEKFTLKDSKKIILYMPTHRKEGKKKMFLNEIFNLNLLNQFCCEHHILFLIKKHYYHNQEIENLEDYDNIKDITQKEYDSQQLLKHADILITDYSSCFVDFLLLNRPVLFYNYDYEEYVVNDRDLYFDYETTTPGVKAKNFNELFVALSNFIIKGIDPFFEKREAVKNIFYSKNNQNKVGRKILDYVKENL
jgi:CDP-glycerol glycerophosphotransferase (TagB/SpsB family)